MKPSVIRTDERYLRPNQTAHVADPGHCRWVPGGFTTEDNLIVALLSPYPQGTTSNELLLRVRCIWLGKISIVTVGYKSWKELLWIYWIKKKNSCRKREQTSHFDFSTKFIRYVKFIRRGCLRLFIVVHLTLDKNLTWNNHVDIYCVNKAHLRGY